jgi:hypothetical protein
VSFHTPLLPLRCKQHTKARFNLWKLPPFKAERQSQTLMAVFGCRKLSVRPNPPAKTPYGHTLVLHAVALGRRRNYPAFTVLFGPGPCSSISLHLCSFLQLLQHLLALIAWGKPALAFSASPGPGSRCVGSLLLSDKIEVSFFSSPCSYQGKITVSSVGMLAVVSHCGVTTFHWPTSIDRPTAVLRSPKSDLIDRREMFCTTGCEMCFGTSRIF